MAKDDVVVRFKKSYSPYSLGELAGFPKHKAEELVRNGIAERYTKEDRAKSTSTAAGERSQDDAAPTGDRGAEAVAVTKPGATGAESTAKSSKVKKPLKRKPSKEE